MFTSWTIPGTTMDGLDHTPFLVPGSYLPPEASSRDKEYTHLLNLASQSGLKRVCESLRACVRRVSHVCRVSNSRKHVCTGALRLGCDGVHEGGSERILPSC